MVGIRNDFVKRKLEIRSTEFQDDWFSVGIRVYVCVDTVILKIPHLNHNNLSFKKYMFFLFAY